MRLDILLFAFLVTADSVCVCTAVFTDFYWQDQDESCQSNRVTREAPDQYEARSNCSSGTANVDSRVDTSQRVKNLRKSLARLSLKAIIIPSTDQHQNEYVAPSDKRLQYITGFTGSAGVAIITATDQVLFTDSRYPLQADKQMDCHWKIVMNGRSKPSPSSWLSENLAAEGKVAADDRLFGSGKWETMEKKLNESQIKLVRSGNFFDSLWKKDGRPSPKSEPIFVHDLEFAGETWQTKISEIRSQLRKKEVDLFIVTSLDEVAWLFNLRGNDFPYTPVFYSYAALEAAENGTTWLFLINPDSLSNKVTQHLTDKACMNTSHNCIELLPYDKVGEFIKNSTERSEIGKILLSKEHAYSQGVSRFIYNAVPDDKRVVDPSPILLAKNKKNAGEVKVLKKTHREDSASLIKFFAFLENEITRGSRIWNESSAAQQLMKTRALNKNYKGDSFGAISAFSDNGAVVHYNPDSETAKTITNESLYLIDSGGQYYGGTTDVTRTMHYGTPTAFQIDCYTRVLMGVLDVTMTVFPNGMKGNFLDALARRPLYERGLLYGHGTGHGIGNYLQVHEGPILISSSSKLDTSLEENNFFSVEPGYYQSNEFGIRIENIVRTAKAANLSPKSTKSMLTFETMTLVPYEPKLINQTLLTQRQCDQVNAYNEEIRTKVGPLLKDKLSTDWLMAKTQPLKCSVRCK